MTHGDHDLRLHFLFDLSGAAISQTAVSTASNTPGTATPAGATTAGHTTAPHKTGPYTASPHKASPHTAGTFEAPSTTLPTRFAIDVSVPGHAPLISMLPEILHLAYEDQPGFQHHDIRWQALTLAGSVLDLDVPLSQLGMVHGSTILLRPYRSVPAPVIRDAAEALAQVAAESTPPASTTQFTSMVGIWGCWLALLLSPWEIPTLLTFAVLVTAAGTAYIIRPYTGYLLTTQFATIVGVALTILQPHEPTALLSTHTRPYFQAAIHALSTHSHQDLLTMGNAWFAASLSLVATTGICIGLASWRQHSFQPFVRTCTMSSIISLGCLLMSAAFPLARNLGYQPIEALSALGIIAVLWASLVTVCSAPIATKIAQVPVIRLPSAGQDLEVSDDIADPQTMHQAAQRATAVLEGILCGTAGCIAVGTSLWILASPRITTGISFVCLLCAGTLLLHAHRHHRGIAVWSLWLATLFCILAFAITGATHPALLIIGLLVCTACATAPWWSRFLKNMAPTTMVWFERLECACLAIILPLGCYLLDLFTLIRGLSL
ncbi:MAG: type VII secretion integral membrane protein EccD [Corynebacterium sp.]|nr:type VII secretion integral membrane protein EccD [Corynebacterium sp.]